MLRVIIQTMDTYKTVRGFAFDELTEKRSRFIGYCKPVSTQDEAIAFINEIKSKHWDARHNVYAYVIRGEGVSRYSDDNEPQGTAGIPVLDAIRKRGITDCVVVVTRYFGGILLGAAGLLRAYTQACSLGLKAAGIVTMEPTVSVLCDVPYPLWDRVQYHLKSQPVQIVSPEYASSVNFTLLVREADCEAVLKDLEQVTLGQMTTLIDETRYQAWAGN